MLFLQLQINIDMLSRPNFDLICYRYIAPADFFRDHVIDNDRYSLHCYLQTLLTVLLWAVDILG